MPSLRKLSLHPTSLLPKVGKDLTVFATSLGEASSDSMSSHLGAMTDYSKFLEVKINENDSNSDCCSPSPPARKRERLDHLSQEEKVMRRKIKNRVAAQSARDRKKARMTELEEQVVHLEAQKKYLLLENSELRNKNIRLEEENTELKKRLGFPSTESEQAQVQEKTVAITENQVVESQEKMDVSGSLEYALLINGPLQKEQDLPFLALLMMRYVYLPITARLMLYLICFSSTAMHCCNTISVPVKMKVKKEEASVKHLVNKWWGPHQKAWNPSKN